MHIFSGEYAELCPHGPGILPIITSDQGFSQLLSRGTFAFAVICIGVTEQDCMLNRDISLMYDYGF